MNASKSFNTHFDSSEFFKIWLTNTLLTIITLSFYRPWARVRTTRYIYQNTELLNKRFDFHGDPKAMFKGHVIAVLAIGIYVITSLLAPLFSGFIALIFMCAMPWLVLRSIRFKLSNTSISGVRFNFAGNTEAVYIIFLKSIAVALLSSIAGAFLGACIGFVLNLNVFILAFAFAVLGFYVAPLIFISHRLIQYIYNHARYGNLEFSSNLEIKAVLITFFVFFGLAILGIALPALVVATSIGLAISIPKLSNFMGVLAIVPFIYFAFAAISKGYIKARMHNIIWNSTTLDHGANRFVSTLSVKRYILLVLKNSILIVLTLGLYIPFAKIKTIEARLNSLEFTADHEVLAKVTEQGSQKGAVADGMFDTIDFDFSL